MRSETHANLPPIDAGGIGDATRSSSQPATAEVLAEVARRRAKARPPMSQAARRVVVLADRFVFWLSGHWLAICNLLAFMYVGVPFLAPVLMHLGVEGPARVIYAVYDLQCHQLPQRSWFLFGPRFFYMLPELTERVGASLVPGPWASDFIGNEAVGYKVALCQRDTAIYGAILLFGLLYGLLRRRLTVPSLRWWAYIAFGILPMLLDGGYQFLSYVLVLFWPQGPVAPHETTPALRVITGALFGLATVWLAYPLVHETMEEWRETLQRRFDWQ